MMSSRRHNSISSSFFHNRPDPNLLLEADPITQDGTQKAVQTYRGRYRVHNSDVHQVESRENRISRAVKYFAVVFVFVYTHTDTQPSEFFAVSNNDTHISCCRGVVVCLVVCLLFLSFFLVVVLKLAPRTRNDKRDCAIDTNSFCPVERSRECSLTREAKTLQKR